MKSVHLGAAGLLCLAALFIFSCTQIVEPAPVTPAVVPPIPVSPPAPVIDAYALYVVNSSGAIMYEDHCKDIYDYPSKDAYYASRYNAFDLEVEMNQIGVGCPWRLITGYIYTPPAVRE
jgi:hypothetical protein